MILLVCGGREYTMRPYDWLRLDNLDASALYEGEADGADLCARGWAESRGVTVRPFPAKWAEHWKAAGPRRNADMFAAAVAEAREVNTWLGVAAFPGGVGTADMVERARLSAYPRLYVFDWRWFDAGEPRQAHAAALLLAAGRTLPASHWSTYRRPNAPRHARAVQAGRT